MALPAGSLVGPYEILTQLGAGGMGEVYRARDLLAPVCARFTEGRDTLDYRYADGLLKTLL